MCNLLYYYDACLFLFVSYNMRDNGKVTKTGLIKMCARRVVFFGHLTLIISVYPNKLTRWASAETHIFASGEFDRSLHASIHRP